MDLIKCPICGEEYSSSYRRCPFCEEEDRPRKVSGKRRGGHHVAERTHTHSARGPLIAVLLVVLAVTTHTFQIPCSPFFTGNFARSATIGIYISKTRITSEA